MLFIFCVVILNLAFGFALAAYLGGHYCMVRKIGLKIPVLLKTMPSMAVGQADVAATEPIHAADDHPIAPE
jgi:hypothetical protein